MSSCYINGIKIPDWVSWNIYNFDNKKVVYLTNEKTHEYLVLEGIAAILWEFIEIEEAVKKICIDNDCIAELNDFLQELLSLGLIISDIGSACSYESQVFQKKDEKELKKFEDEKKALIVKNGYLPSLLIELTYKCNENCIHCYNNKNMNSCELRFNELKHIIDEAYELGTPVVTLTGGECTSNRDFFKIASYIRSKKISLEFFTNGQNLYDNEILFDKVVSIYPHRIALSVYSMNPDIHDKITGVKGSHFKTISVIKKLKERNIIVQIKCFLMQDNAKEYLDVAKFAEEIGVCVSFDCKFLNNPLRNNSGVKITNQQMFDLYTDKNSLLYAKNEINSDIEDKNFIERRICGGDNIGLSISADSNIYVCPSWKVPLGNIKSSSLIKIWSNKKANSLLQKIKDIKIADLKECFKYEYCKHCVYCPGETLQNNRYLKRYEAFCNDAIVRMHAYKKNKEKESGCI